MKKLPIFVALLWLLVLPVSALEITAPQVPESGEDLMPEDVGTFWQGVLEILRDGISHIRPDLAEAAAVCLRISGVVLLVSLLGGFSGTAGKTAELAGIATIGAMLLSATHSLIALGQETVTEMAEYGKLLLPVMTSAMAAQGAVTTSAALYTGTAAFNALLSAGITGLLLPLAYVFLALAIVGRAIGESPLRKLCDLVRKTMVWLLKTILYLFTGYMSITGVISGTTDAATLKATRLTISGMVPVVGNILSDASEAVLVSAGIAKNAAGIYGCLALLAVCLGPFLRIGVQYLLLKITGTGCSIFGSDGLCGLMEDFTTVMGLVLAMTGAVCLMLLISTVCFLREVG